MGDSHRAGDFSSGNRSGWAHYQVSPDLWAQRRKEVACAVKGWFARSGWAAKRRLWLTVCVAVGLLAFPGTRLTAQQDVRAVRAAYVYNLTKYVSWPESKRRLVIGVLDEDRMGPVLKRILERKVSDGREIDVVLGPSDEELRGCDVVYFSDSSPSKINALLNRIGNEAILTVGESDQFARSGGMVGLVHSGDQIEIEVNLSALRNRKLEMSSRLLNLAVIVSGSGRAR